MKAFKYTILLIAAISFSFAGCKKEKDRTPTSGGGGGGSGDTEFVVPSSGNNTITTCSGVIKDHAGDEDYENNIDGYTVIVPANDDENIQLSFTSFELENLYDFVTVFDGIGTGGSELFNGSGTTLPPTITASNGPLTIRHTSDLSETFAGFEANISCVSGGGGDDTFECISGNCFNVGSGGAFSSLSDCEANCGGSSDTFDCISGNCFNVGSGGTFSSQADCEANCGGSSDTFNCVSGNCVNVGSGGTFSSLADCQNNCGGSSSDCCDCTGIGFTCDICCDGEFDMLGESWDSWLALFEQSGCNCE